jgi:hypothetical protein
MARYLNCPKKANEEDEKDSRVLLERSLGT